MQMFSASSSRFSFLLRSFSTYSQNGGSLEGRRHTFDVSGLLNALNTTTKSIFFFLSCHITNPHCRFSSIFLSNRQLFSFWSYFNSQNPKIDTSVIFDHRLFHNSILQLNPYCKCRSKLLLLSTFSIIPQGLISWYEFCQDIKKKQP